MKEKTEKIFWLFLVPLGIGIILIIVSAVIGGITFKMVYETLMGLDFLVVSGVLLLIIAAVFGILYVKQRWEVRVSGLKSELKEKTKEYDDLVELTKLPPEDKIITIEPARYPEVATRENSAIPELQFMFDVHNHTYYHFTPKRAELTCSNSGKEVVKDEWDIAKDKEYISARKHIKIDPSLPKYQARSIIFKVPIKNTYPDWYNWAFDGYVTYTNGEEEQNVKIEDIRHHLSDKNIHKLEEMLKKVEGDDK